MIPYRDEPHPSSGLTNVRLGMWLFVAVQAMFSASLLSSHVLLSAGIHERPDPVSGPLTVTTLTSGVLLVLSWAALPRADEARLDRTRVRLALCAACALLFVLWRCAEAQRAARAGAVPSAHVLIGSWFVLSGLHVVYVMCGAIVTAWLAAGGRDRADSDRKRLRRRLSGLRIYWGFVVILWFAILVTLFVS